MTDHCGRGNKPKLRYGGKNFGLMLSVTEACKYHHYQQKNKKHLVPLQGYEKFQMDV